MRDIICKIFACHKIADVYLLNKNALKDDEELSIYEFRNYEATSAQADAISNEGYIVRDTNVTWGYY